MHRYRGSVAKRPQSGFRARQNATAGLNPDDHRKTCCALSPLTRSSFAGVMIRFASSERASPLRRERNGTYTASRQCP